MENIYQFNIINKVNINEVTKDDNNSILLIKIQIFKINLLLLIQILLCIIYKLIKKIIIFN